MIRLLTRWRLEPERKLTVSKFRRRKVLLWAYWLGWVAAIVWLWTSGLAFGWKIAIQTVLVFFTPDSEILFESYRGYERDFSERRNVD